MLDIGCIGDIAVDYISTVIDFPQKNSNCEIKEFSKSFGGSAANTAIMCAYLGVKTGLHACIGVDFPLEYEHELKKSGLKANLIKTSLHTTSAMLYSNGEEQLTFFYRGASRELNNAKIPDEILNANIIHLCRDFTGAFRKIIENSNAKISFNPGYGLDEIPKNELEFILEHTHILFINRHEQKYLTDLFTIEESEIRSIGPDIVVLTIGSEGCKIITEKVESVPAIPAKLVDPTGAGDSFTAGFLTGYSKGYPLEACARLGAATASITIGTRGTHPKLTWDKVVKITSIW